MDLKMEEINNSDNQTYLNSTNLSNHQKYWEQTKNQTEKKKKKVSPEKKKIIAFCFRNTINK